MKPPLSTPYAPSAAHPGRPWPWPRNPCAPVLQSRGPVVAHAGMDGVPLDHWKRPALQHLRVNLARRRRKPSRTSGAATAAATGAANQLFSRSRALGVSAEIPPAAGEPPPSLENRGSDAGAAEEGSTGTPSFAQNRPKAGARRTPNGRTVSDRLISRHSTLIRSPSRPGTHAPPCRLATPLP